MLRDNGERLILNDNWNLKTKMEHIHRYTAVSNRVQDKIVLDAACGTGYGTELLSRYARQAIGIDLSAEAVQYAEDAFQKDNLEYEVMSVTNLAFSDNYFDVVVSFETIEHITKEQQKEFLSEICRVLKDTGVLYISTPNDELERRLTFGAYTNPFHICEFTEREFETFLRQYFKNVKIYYQSVSSASILQDKAMEQSNGELYSNGLESATERFYIAVCTNSEAPVDAHLGSVYKPNLQDYYDEVFFLRRASVYVDIGNGFDGKEFIHSKCYSQDGKTFNYHFDLSQIQNIKALRFDPAEHAGIFKITSIRSNIPEVTIHPANADSTLHGVDTFTTMDPIYFITADNLAQIQSVDISGEILQEIPDYMAWNNIENQLERKRGKIAQLENELLSHEAMREAALAEVKSILANNAERTRQFEEQLLNQSARSEAELAELKSILANNAERTRQLEEKLLNQSVRGEAELAEVKSILVNNAEQARQLEILPALIKEAADLNFMLQKQLRDTNDIIFLSKNIHRTTEDLRYVMQHSGWYHRAMRRIAHPTFIDYVNSSMQEKGICGSAKAFVKNCIKKLYKKSRGNKFAVTSLRAVRRLVNRMFPRWGEKTVQIISESRLENNQEVTTMMPSGVKTWIGEKRRPFKEKPLVSVIVPNFNHSAFLRERLESVYNQTYPNFEVILLDDCSTDNSRDILMEYAEKYPDKTILDFNETNGGRVFKQWNKGINHARGKLIWIAESDDWCELDFLEKMVPQFEYESVMLAFCRSVFMQDGKQIWTLEEYLADIHAFDFSRPFVVSAHVAVREGFALKNLVPNVSSAMFRNVGQIPADITDIWQNIKLCGDWLFYLNTIKGGCLSYTNETVNYYRIHANSTSLKIQKSAAYYSEQEQISRFVMKNFNVDLAVFQKVLTNLEKHYASLNNTNDLTVVHENYQLERIGAMVSERKPNILMCCYSLQMGGGETYPIYLANEMKKQGACIALLNFNLEGDSQNVRDMIDSAIPVITLQNPDYIGRILELTGANIVHSHHASVDQMVSEWLQGMHIPCKQVVSLHGMYETIDKEICKIIFANLTKTCGQFVFTADKNLMRIEELQLLDKLPLVKLGNALPMLEIHPMERALLNIGQDDFVLCLVSRAIKEKGWQEAAEAVLLANKTSKRKVHLLLIGDGPMKKKLESVQSPYIHVLGQKSNIRDYFAIADMGFLPSAFPGESFPLVVVDSLMAGKPLLASDIGEIRNQLLDSNSEIAGELFSLQDWKIDVADLAERIVHIAQDDRYYQTMVDRVSSAVKKFDISDIARKYQNIYQRIYSEWER